MNSLYDFPQAYDAVMNRPDAVVETEVRTITALLARHQLTGGKILELACGACAHGLRLAACGYQVTGLDRAQAMLAEAQRRAVAAGVQVETVAGDILDFDLPGKDFVAAIFLFETFPLITEYTGIVRHFAAVRRHLQAGALYIIDIDVHPHGVRMESGEWGRRTVPLPGGYVETWCEDYPGNWIENTNHLVLRCRITLDDTIYETKDDWQIRVYSPWELALLVRTLPGWTLDGFYSWQGLDRDLVQEKHYFMVLRAG